MSLSPLFAQGWYDTPHVTQLRQEVLNIYRLLGGGGVQVIMEPMTVEEDSHWGAHFVALEPLRVALTDSVNGMTVTLANHSSGTVGYEAMPGVTTVPSGEINVAQGGVVGAICDGMGTWYLYGEMV